MGKEVETFEVPPATDINWKYDQEAGGGDFEHKPEDSPVSYHKWGLVCPEYRAQQCDDKSKGVATKSSSHDTKEQKQT